MDVKTMTNIITAIEGYFAVCDGLENLLGTNCSEPTDDSPFYKFTALFEIVERFTAFDIKSNEGGQITLKHYLSPTPPFPSLGFKFYPYGFYYWERLEYQ